MEKAGTVYGYRRSNGDERFPDYSRELIESLCRDQGYTLIAYDVSPVRVVSIR